MKKLYIMRHGKSSWDYDEIKDYDRPLKKRGINDAYKVAQFLNEQGTHADGIISSFANRALHTSIIVARKLGYPLQLIQIEPNIYFGSLEETINIIKSQHEDLNNLMLFGHNPNATDISNLFLQEKIDNLPTAGCVEISLNINSWKELSEKYCVETKTIFPKEL